MLTTQLPRFSFLLRTLNYASYHVHKDVTEVRGIWQAFKVIKIDSVPTSGWQLLISLMRFFSLVALITLNNRPLWMLKPSKRVSWTFSLFIKMFCDNIVSPHWNYESLAMLFAPSLNYDFMSKSFNRFPGNKAIIISNIQNARLLNDCWMELLSQRTEFY